MNILVASSNLKTTGLGTFIYTQVTELLKRGYNVDVVTLYSGKVGDKLSSNLISIDSVKESYDLILTNQNDITDELVKRNVKGRMIFTVHGVAFDWNDCPSEDNLKRIDKVVSVSTRIQNLLRGDEKSQFFDWDRKIDSVVINNPIDCERFKPTPRVDNWENPPRPRVLSMVRGEAANKILQSACDILGYNLIEWQKPVDYIFSEHDEDRVVFNVEEKIQYADIVVGLGRIIHESLASGKNALIFDDREYQGNLGDGMVTLDNILSCCLEYNCSGRFSCKSYDVDLIINELKLFKPNNGKFFRNFILENFNVVDKIDEYLSL